MKTILLSTFSFVLMTLPCLANGLEFWPGKKDCPQGEEYLKTASADTGLKLFPYPGENTMTCNKFSTGPHCPAVSKQPGITCTILKDGSNSAYICQENASLRLTDKFCDKGPACRGQNKISRPTFTKAFWSYDKKVKPSVVKLDGNLCSMVSFYDQKKGIFSVMIDGKEKKQSLKAKDCSRMIKNYKEGASRRQTFEQYEREFEAIKLCVKDFEVSFGEAPTNSTRSPTRLRKPVKKKNAFPSGKSW